MHDNIDVHSRIFIAEFPGDEINCTETLQSYCSNVTFAENFSYDRSFQQVTHKVGESEMNYIKIFKNSHALSVSVGYAYSEDQLMHTFLDKFYQGGKLL